MGGEQFPAEFLSTIQPIVLVGGASRRFGRDKLREPWGPDRRCLVSHPIEALRSVFGPRVALVGDCHASIVPLADGVIPDTHPGIGPIGGIVSALESRASPVFVLAGDMPRCRAETIRTILRAALDRPLAHAALAASGTLHPCAGLYRPGALPALQASIAAGRHALKSALPGDAVCLVQCHAEELANINLPEDLGGG